MKIEKFFDDRLTNKFNLRIEGYVYPEAFLSKFQQISNMEVHDRDVWVASFPKSGTTWTQEMVWLIANDLDYKKALQVDLDERFPFLEFPGIRGKIDENDPPPKYLVDCFNFIQEMKKPRFIKTHVPWDLLPAQIKNGAKKPKIIYVSRNPKDVCVSLYHHHKNLLEEKRGLEEFSQLFLEDLITAGPYWKSINSYWTHRNEANVLLIKFEDMKNDLHGVITKVCRFLNKNFSDEEIAKLAEHLDFKNMKNNKAANKDTFLYYARKADGNVGKEDFLRGGKVGGYKSEMSDDLIEKFNTWEQENLKKYKMYL